MRILLIEDDLPLGAAIRQGLEKQGAIVTWGTGVEDGLTAAQADRFYVMMLDLSLPDGDGLDLLKSLRRQGDNTPILVVTARDGRNDRILGLDLGADDYVTKPFDMDELGARLRALVRRSEGRSTNELEASGLRLNLTDRTLFDGLDLVNVTAKELRVIELLMRKAGRFVSKPDLENSLYDGETAAESNTIETAIYGLRRKLGSERIITARGLGYMVPKT